jgi:hypothetical protein
VPVEHVAANWAGFADACAGWVFDALAETGGDALAEVDGLVDGLAEAGFAAEPAGEPLPGAAFDATAAELQAAMEIAMAAPISTRAALVLFTTRLFT